MELRNEMDTILKKRKGLNINDDFGIEKCWNKMTILLTQNEYETIDYLISPIHTPEYGAYKLAKKLG